MPDAFAEFLATPSGDTFVPLRAIVIESPEYDFQSQGDAELLELIQAENYAAVPDQVAQLMPDWLLCPAVHRLAAHAALKTGDKQTAGREQFLAHACMRGLLQSGDGSRERPYLVTHVADEYELLNHLKKQPGSHRQVTDLGGTFDLIACQDGSEVWFDISAGVLSR